MSRFAATSDAIRVLVADSSRMQAQLLYSALRRHSEFRIATCSFEAAALLQAVESVKPKVALLSLSSSDNLADSMAVLRRLHLSHPEILKILLIDSSDPDLVINGFRSGARGIFVLADGNLRVLCKCILRVADGQIWANTEQLNYVLDLFAEIPSLRVVNSSGHQLLTPREEQVVALVAEGLANREIARELNLSEHTIKKYLFHIFEKLGISNRVELVLYAVNHGDPGPAGWIGASDRNSNDHASM